MSLSSLVFVAFVVVVYLAFRLSPTRWQGAVLLVASAVFYASWEAPHLLLAFGLVTLWSYGWACRLPLVAAGRSKGGWLAVAIAGNLAVLGAFKYLPGTALGAGSKSPLASIGVSYFVVQAVAYLVDVYLEMIKPERPLGRFVLFLGFFPKLLQGPIERASSLLPQLRDPKPLDRQEVRAGLLLFLWGLFQKLAIADRLAPYVDLVYGDVQAHAGLPAMVATYLYAFQLYFDFAGYTDMAIGVGMLFGIRLTPNFKAPYLSPSIADFWRRWHISFSSFLLDYLFRPVQLSLRSLRVFASPIALFVTFLVSGLWHGTGLQFLAWGALHGLYLAAAVLTEPARRRLRKRLRLDTRTTYRAFRILVTFHLVCLAWVFFRSKDLPSAWFVLSHLGSETRRALQLLLSQGVSHLLLTVIALGIAGAAWARRELPRPAAWRAPGWAYWATCYSLVLAILMLAAERTAPFLYLQF